MTKSSSKTWFYFILMAIIVAILSVTAALYWAKQQQSHLDIITHEGVLQRIQHLNNLETVAFHVDTVVTSHKPGSWNRLWQDQQKGLFVAKGRVIAGLNLSKLNADNVMVSQDGKSIHFKLPAVEILSSSLDKTEVYDIQTGLFGLMDIDPRLLSEAQDAARIQIIKTACQSGILNIANDNAQKQIASLFTLTQAKVTVDAAAVPQCG